MTKRLCLFAGYNSQNILEDYVIYYLQKMSKFTDVYYCADCDIPHEELQKIFPYTIKAQAVRHNKYDFGSWSILFQDIPNLKDYDELILVNDSVFGPLFSLDKYFNEMSNKDISAWSLCATRRFMMSFFIVLKKEVFLSDWFKSFILSIEHYDDKGDIVHFYEDGLSKLIEQHNLKWVAIFSKKNIYSIYKQNLPILHKKLRDISFYLRWTILHRPKKIHLYKDNYFILFLLKFPFIKKRAFIEENNHFHKYAPRFISLYSDYDYALISKSIELNKLYPPYTPLIKKIFISLGKFIFDKRCKSNCTIYRVFKIKVYVKKLNSA